jgi:long-chain acyl-CoA synthetase
MIRWLGGAPGDPALVTAERRVTYAELTGRADRVAAGLLAAGCAPGDRVLALLPSGAEIYELLLGCVRSGMVLVPLNWRLTADELAEVAADAKAAALVTGDGFGAVAARLAAQTTGRLHVTVGPPQGSVRSYEDWLAAQSPTGFERRTAPDRVVLQVYTSGTSGRPKGVLLTEGNLATKVPRAARIWELGPRSVSLLATPLFHIGGLSWGLAGLHSGARTLVAGSASPTDLLVTMRSERVTHTFLVPTMLERMCQLAGGARFPDLRAIVYGAAPIDPWTQRAAPDVFGCRLLHVYGMTETTGAVTQLDSTEVDPVDPRARSVGRPYPWVEVSVRDPLGLPTPPGVPGEVWTRSGQNTPGYYGDAAATSALLASDGWLRTGDGGHLDDGGYLFLTHRIKDLIISGGENVLPIEVEAVLRQHPDVADVAVVGLPDRRWGEVVAAVVVPRAARALTGEDVLAWAAGRLAGYKRPRVARVVSGLPRTATGKIRKGELVGLFDPLGREGA